jgi:hypothetical protein
MRLALSGDGTNHKSMRLKSLALVAVVVVLAVAGSNCICIDYFNPPMQWYNYGCNALSNVTI